MLIKAVLFYMSVGLQGFLIQNFSTEKVLIKSRGALIQPPPTVHSRLEAKNGQLFRCRLKSSGFIEMPMILFCRIEELRSRPVSVY